MFSLQWKRVLSLLLPTTTTTRTASSSSYCALVSAQKTNLPFSSYSPTIRRNMSGGSNDSTTPEQKRPEEYVPPKVWTWDSENGGTFAKVNRPISGATHEKVLPVGKHPFQLYSLGTPNGRKVTIMFEELVALGIKEAEYDAWLIKISGDQFGSGFCDVNPNSKIPAMMDHSVQPPVRVFESGNILLYLADKFQKFIPSDVAQRTECLNWLFWQMGSAPFLGGGFGHFFCYAPYKMEYPINRYTMEVKRQMDVLDKHLAKNKYMVGEEYTIADMAIFPWYGHVVLGKLYSGSAEFLNVEKDYPNVIRWAKEISERPAVKRGLMVNVNWGELSDQLHERHDASDFETKTQDKVQE